jgi:hypothetical protein
LLGAAVEAAGGGGAKETACMCLELCQLLI